jgi:hypothetical protein
MGIDPSVLFLFSDDTAKEVFSRIAREQTIRLITLRESLDELDDQQLQDSLSKLKTADLIMEHPASIPDFNTYYLTANGLSAEKQLRLAEPAESSSLSFAKRR